MSLLVMCASTTSPGLTANLHDADSATVTLLGYSASVLAPHFYSSSRGYHKVMMVVSQMGAVSRWWAGWWCW